jgi:hypothetical protein
MREHSAPGAVRARANESRRRFNNGLGAHAVVRISARAPCRPSPLLPHSPLLPPLLSSPLTNQPTPTPHPTPLAPQARGKSGPLFQFDVHDDVRLVNDSRVEKDESHPGKVVQRRWYERNRHIFPASRWEVYDPAVVRTDGYTTHGREVVPPKGPGGGGR